jgi:hypothetical protein
MRSNGERHGRNVNDEWTLFVAKRELRGLFVAENRKTRILQSGFNDELKVLP